MHKELRSLVLRKAVQLRRRGSHLLHFKGAVDLVLEEHREGVATQSEVDVPVAHLAHISHRKPQDRGAVSLVETDLASGGVDGHFVVALFSLEQLGPQREVIQAVFAVVRQQCPITRRKQRNCALADMRSDASRDRHVT